MQESTCMSMLCKISLAAIFAISLLAMPQSASAQAAVPAAPVPEQIITAKTVFIANGGADSNLSTTLKGLGGRDTCYNQFYAGMKSWARYQLVSSPEEAELVFEIRFKYVLGPSMELQLTVMDAKTHFTLWRVSEYVQGAARQATMRKNFVTAMNAVLNDAKNLCVPGAP